MKCKVACSFAEVVDKKSILCIKLKKIKCKKALHNITNELKAIERDVPLITTEDGLFDELYKINYKLWILEDLIRKKSEDSEFDNQYIEYAESIHVTNDKRYDIKKKINIKYNSYLLEEKGYHGHTVEEVIDINNNDILLLEHGKHLYTSGQYDESYSKINKLMNKYKNYKINDTFYIDLLFSYANICMIFNYENTYYNKIKNIMTNIKTLSISNELKTHIKIHWATINLALKNYKAAYIGINLLNVIKGTNIHPDNMSFFSVSDINKTLLLYDGGGLGDIIMLARFIPTLCGNYSNNKIILLTHERNVNMFKNTFEHITNIRIVPISQSHNLGDYDYHCSMFTLIKYMNMDYSDITFTPLFANITFDGGSIVQKQIIADIKTSSNKTFIFNWKGNNKNSHELHNRRIELVNAVRLFNIKDINWIVITKDITLQEKQILNKYNVKYYGDVLDNGENCFEDSINIIKNVDGLISTDTSLVHLSSNLNIKTYVMLTTGCEWRWTRNDNYTKWYPTAILLRQKIRGEWSNVIEELYQRLVNDKI